MRQRSTWTVWPAVLVLLLTAAFVRCAGADVFYVDNLQGNDGFDGRSDHPVGRITGPTKTISRALRLARGGDTIIVANTGTPYYESLSLAGPKSSGYRGLPFTIVGNGAIVDGSRRVPPRAWKRIGANLWRFVPWRKGYFQLLLNDKPVPEFREKVPRTNATGLSAKIPAGQWTVWKGAIYYRTGSRESPAELPFRYAYHSVGATLYDVSNVRLVDLTFRFFRLDGVNAHDRCRSVTLEKIKALGNGRSGIAVGGTSAILIRNCEATGNRLNSLLISERGSAKVEDSKLDRPPTVRKD